MSFTNVTILGTGPALELINLQASGQKGGDRELEELCTVDDDEDNEVRAQRLIAMGLLDPDRKRYTTRGYAASQLLYALIKQAGVTLHGVDHTPDPQGGGEAVSK